MIEENNNCMECGQPLPTFTVGYCKPCIARLTGKELPATIGCAECLGEGAIGGEPCEECGGSGQVPWN